MTTKLTKRKYEKPAMRVCEMREQPRLLQASATMDVNYYQEDI